MADKAVAGAAGRRKRDRGASGGAAAKAKEERPRAARARARARFVPTSEPSPRPRGGHKRSARRRRRLPRRSSQIGLWGASRPSVVSEDDESVEFSKMDQPSTTGPSSSSESTTCVKSLRHRADAVTGAWRSLISTLLHCQRRGDAGGRAGGAASCFSAEGGCGRMREKSPGPSGLPPLLVWRWLRCPEGAEAAPRCCRAARERVFGRSHARPRSLRG